MKFGFLGPFCRGPDKEVCGFRFPCLLTGETRSITLPDFIWVIRRPPDTSSLYLLAWPGWSGVELPGAHPAKWPESEIAEAYTPYVMNPRRRIALFKARQSRRTKLQDVFIYRRTFQVTSPPLPISMVFISLLQ